MARKRPQDSDAEYSDRDGDEDYAPKSSAKKRAPGAVKRRKRTNSVYKDASKTSDQDTIVAESAPPSSHPAASHVIAEPSPLREALLEWYEGVHAARGMPWRKPYDPSMNNEQRAQRAYEVWVSEIMLQQTQVVTVIPYYNRWMKKYPTIRDLAASDIETVNSIWRGLGYYSRAARLLAGAQKAVRDFGGRLPDNAKVMEANIPGIGRYSAGAICSIAYNECVPVLDGNVHRLLSRILAVHAPPKSKQTLDILWQGATAMVEGSTRPGDLNQALIELGSTVCKVRDPSCGSCPLQPWCQAVKLADGKEPEGAASKGGVEVRDIEEICTLCEPLPVGRPVTSFPMRAEKKKAREELDIVNVIEWRSQAGGGGRWFLLVRRPEGGLLGGLHEFPTSPAVPVTISAAAQKKVPSALLRDLLTSPPAGEHGARTSGDQARGEISGAEPEPSTALRIVHVEPAGDVIHIFSHIRKTYRVQWVVLEGGGGTPPALAAPCRGRVVASGAATQRARAGGRTPKTRVGVSESLTAAPGDGDDQLHAARAAWVPMADVANANIGTGVLKVWRRACTLWAA